MLLGVDNTNGTFACIVLTDQSDLQNFIFDNYSKLKEF